MGIYKRRYWSHGHLLLPLLILIFLTPFVACQQKQAEVGVLPEKITIAYPKSVYSVLFAVAKSKGFFKAAGLEVVPQLHDFGKIAVQSMLEGKAEMAISGDTVAMFAIVRGQPIYIIAENMTSKRNEAIVARKDRGINKPIDLEGKKIGVALGTTGHFFLDSFLSVNGIRKEKIKIVNMKPGEMNDAIKKGAIEAVAVWQPHLKQLERQLGDNGVVFYDERIYSDIVCLSASRDFVKKRPEAVKKILQALIRAEAFVKENPDETRRLVADFLKTDKTIIDEIWDTLNFKVSLEQSLLVSLEDQTRWARENKLIESRETPKYLDHIDFDGLQAVKPAAVTVIR
jgi:ABC-type nitrate/sulfonate/bicarbonate transport system substrate-binding protein